MAVVNNLSAMQEIRAQFLGWEDPPKKEMATYSSILAWEIPRTEEPGGLQAMGSQSAGHNWALLDALYLSLRIVGKSK